MAAWARLGRLRALSLSLHNTNGVSELPVMSDDTWWMKILTVMLGSSELENDLESLVRGSRNKKTKNRQKERREKRKNIHSTKVDLLLKSSSPSSISTSSVPYWRPHLRQHIKQASVLHRPTLILYNRPPFPTSRASNATSNRPHEVYIVFRHPEMHIRIEWVREVRRRGGDYRGKRRN